MAKHPLSKRFRGFLPVVVDVETAGFDPKKNALLEVAVQPIRMQEDGSIEPGEVRSEHILPFKGADLDPKALAFNKIDPHHPFRFAKEEKEALKELFGFIKDCVKQVDCNRAVLVGHNAWFDLSFILQASIRTKIQSPFHSFTSFDTATLAGVFYGQTVLAKAMEVAGLPFDAEQAHSAKYDTEATTALFCSIINRYKDIGGWPL